MFGAIRLLQEGEGRRQEADLSASRPTSPERRAGRPHRRPRTIPIPSPRTDGQNLRSYLSSTGTCGFYYHPRIDPEGAQRTQQRSRFTACLGGEARDAADGIAGSQRRAAQQFAVRARRFLLEDPAERPLGTRSTTTWRRMSRETGIPWSRPATALHQARCARARDLMAIQQGRTPVRREAPASLTVYVRLLKERRRVQPRRRSSRGAGKHVRIAPWSNVELKLGKPMLPRCVPEGFTSPLLPQAVAGWAAIGAFPSLPDPAKGRSDQYASACSHRGGRHLQDGLPGYFLIVWGLHQFTPKSTAFPSDRAAAPALARWSRTRCASPISIPFPATCCSSASNPERISMPDFDVDFCMTGATRSSLRQRKSTARTQGSDHHLRSAVREYRRSKTSGRVLGCRFPRPI